MKMNETSEPRASIPELSESTFKENSPILVEDQTTGHHLPPLLAPLAENTIAFILASEILGPCRAKTRRKFS